MKRFYYFIGDKKNGFDKLQKLEDECVKMQKVDFCKKIRVSKKLAGNYSFLESNGYKYVDCNPHACEGECESRIYHTTKDGKISFCKAHSFKGRLIKLFYHNIMEN